MRKGFVFIELIIILAILSVMVAIAVVSIAGTGTHRATLSASVDTLVTDLRSQQVAAMSNRTKNNTEVAGWGIAFFADKYVLFAGNGYEPSDEANTTVQLDESIELSAIDTPGNVVLFSVINGEVVGFDASHHSVTVKRMDSGDSKKIFWNRYGTITHVE